MISAEEAQVEGSSKDYLVKDARVLEAAILQFLCKYHPAAADTFSSSSQISFNQFKALTRTDDLLEKKWAATTRLQIQLSRLERENVELQEKIERLQKLSGRLSIKDALPRSPPLATLKQSNRAVTKLAAHPMMMCFAVASADHTIKLINAENHRRPSVLKCLTGHTDGIKDIVFDTSGLYLCSGALDGEIKVWSLTNLECTRTLKGHGDGILACQIIPWKLISSQQRGVAAGKEGDGLLTASRDGTIRLWNIRDGSCIKTYLAEPDLEYVTCMDLWAPHNNSTCGPILACGGANFTVGVWRLYEHKPYLLLRGHTHTLDDVIFAPEAMLDHMRSAASSPSAFCEMFGEPDRENDFGQVPNCSWGPVLISGGRDARIKIWDVDGGRCIATLYGHDNWVKSIAADPSGRFIASSSDDRSIKIWDVTDCKLKRTIRSDAFITSLSYFSMGGALLSGSLSGSVAIWELDDSENSVDVEQQQSSVLLNDTAREDDIRKVLAEFTSQKKMMVENYGGNTAAVVGVEDTPTEQGDSPIVSEYVSRSQQEEDEDEMNVSAEEASMMPVVSLQSRPVDLLSADVVSTTSVQHSDTFEQGSSRGAEPQTEVTTHNVITEQVGRGDISVSTTFEARDLLSSKISGENVSVQQESVSEAVDFKDAEPIQGEACTVIEPELDNESSSSSSHHRMESDMSEVQFAASKQDTPIVMRDQQSSSSPRTTAESEITPKSSVVFSGGDLSPTPSQFEKSGGGPHDITGAAQTAAATKKVRPPTFVGGTATTTSESKTWTHPPASRTAAGAPHKQPQVGSRFGQAAAPGQATHSAAGSRLTSGPRATTAAVGASSTTSILSSQQHQQSVPSPQTTAATPGATNKKAGLNSSSPLKPTTVKETASGRRGFAQPLKHVGGSK